VPGAIIAPVTPILPLGLGLLALAAGVAVLRSYGSRYRVGRLLSSVPRVTIGEAVELASGPARYVAVRGRIDADDPFEDDAHRPLVFRRTRFDHRSGSAWVTFDDRREAVPFEVRDGPEAIGIDTEALGDGLVVVVREAVGTGADLGDRLPADIEPTAPVRMLVEQVSSVEHAIVLGVPRTGGTGTVLTAGLGRPLVLTTLEPPEAMRILSGSDRRPVLAAGLLAGGLVLLAVALGWALISAIL
jgi:hypothetical protein